MFRKIALALLVVFIAMQLYRPDKNIAEGDVVAAFEAETMPSAAVKTILAQNCYDCHSNNTVYPWYAEVAPISYMIANHVDEGKEHFNVSDWSNWDFRKKDHKLDELIEEVEEGHMPESSYTWLHGNMSEAEVESLISWAKEARAKLK
ncbi:heme-binding domain-containing protein [Croceivirga radicis]|uniref:heme-binding domain-containing protein n=1 Tax=Croceivirga radicis TaxID=1929488 RepID=UPI000255AF81|nr:heme-binding domain-containing protein [Croceivirga radicis]